MTKLTEGEVRAALKEAAKKGSEAGSKRAQELKQLAVDNNGSPVEEECGGARVVVKIDGRSALAKMLKKENAITNLGAGTASEYGLQLDSSVKSDPQVNFQNRTIRERVAEAQSESLKATLGLETSVRYYTD